jgi:hypothetical protein
MAFDLTKPSMTDVDWPTFAANIRENFRAIVQGDDNVFTSGVTTGWRLRTTGTTSQTSLSLLAGNATTSSRFAYYEVVANETALQQWRFGVYGDKHFRIVNATLGTLSFTISSTDDQVTFLSPALNLTHGTSNFIIWPAAQVGPPTLTTRSTSTRLVFFPGVGAASVDFAEGIDNFTLWRSVPTTAYFHKFYWKDDVLLTLSAGRMHWGGAGVGSTANLKPTVAVAAGFGTTPTIALDAGSTDNAGIVTVTAGTTPGATGSVTVTFGTLNGAYGTNTPTVVITPLDGTGAWDTGITWKLTACSTTAFTVAFKNAATNFTAASTYRFSYHVIGK